MNVDNETLDLSNKAIVSGETVRFNQNAKVDKEQLIISKNAEGLQINVGEEELIIQGAAIQEEAETVSISGIDCEIKDDVLIIKNKVLSEWNEVFYEREVF